VAAGSVTAKGTVAPVASRTLSFAISGTVSEVKVKAGDLVTAGQLLARLDSTDAQAAVTDAEESLSSAQDALDEAEAAATATCAPSSSGSTKPSDDPTPKPTSGSTTCGSSGSSRQGGGDAIFSAQQQVNNAQAALAKAKRDLAGTRITAPVAGKVLSVSVKVGDTARSNVITLGVVSQMVVKASFSESDVVALQVGQTATITLPGTGDKTYPAKVTQVAELGTVSNRLVTYEVLITFDEVPAGLLVGQSANVTVPA
jgi:HlyD family secretion protein